MNELLPARVDAKPSDRPSDTPADAVRARDDAQREQRPDMMSRNLTVVRPLPCTSE